MIKDKMKGNGWMRVCFKGEKVEEKVGENVIMGNTQGRVNVKCFK